MLSVLNMAILHLTEDAPVGNLAAQISQNSLKNLPQKGTFYNISVCYFITQFASQNGWSEAGLLPREEQ